MPPWLRLERSSNSRHPTPKLTIIWRWLWCNAEMPTPLSENFAKPSGCVPSDSGFQGNLGTAYLQKTDFDAAAAQFRAALKIDPEQSNSASRSGLGA